MLVMASHALPQPISFAPVIEFFAAKLIVVALGSNKTTL
jgi:hypothetical protein